MRTIAHFFATNNKIVVKIDVIICKLWYNAIVIYSKEQNYGQNYGFGRR